MRQRGNILFLILLAVVLFAALSYAVTNSMRGGGRNAGKEKVSLLASQLLENTSLIRHNMMRAMLVDNVKDYGFDVSHTGGNSNGNATCTSASCRIYMDKGGNVPVLHLPLWAAGTSPPEQNPYFRTPVVMDVGTDAPDLVLYYRGISKELCEAINARLGLSIDLATTELFSTAGSYSGTLTSFPAQQGLLGDEITTLKGHTNFCMYNTPAVGYIFVSVLIER